MNGDVTLMGGNVLAAVVYKALRDRGKGYKEYGIRRLPEAVKALEKALKGWE